MSLPTWIEDIMKSPSFSVEDFVKDTGNLYKALAIAWKELEDMKENDFFYTELKAKDAMRRIEELGGCKHSSTNQFTGICPHCGKDLNK